MEQQDQNTQIENSDVIPILSMPPPPPPADLLLENIMFIKTDQFIQNRLKNMNLFDGVQTDELSSKIKKVEDIHEKACADGEGTGEGLQKQDGEGRIQCERCEHWFTEEEMPSHKIQHSSQDTINQNIAIHFDQCIEFIDNAQKEGKNILVHCIQGVSRSASVVLAYLMTKKGMTLKESFDYVKERRSVIKPNPAFTKDLLEYERKLYNTNSCTGDYINNLFKD